MNQYDFPRWYVPILAKCALAAAVFAPGAVLAQTDLAIYSNGSLVNGWENYSYSATLNFATNPAYTGSSYSMSVTITGAYGGFQPYIPPMSDAGYSSVSFWLNGGASGGQHLQMYGNEGTGPTAQSARVFMTAPAANIWRHYTVTLQSLGVSNVSNFSGFAIQDSAGGSEPTFFLDDVELLSSTPFVASAGPSQTICTGASATIGGSPTASGGSGGGYSYSWSPTNGLSSATAANPIASPTSTTTYNLIVTDSLANTAISSVTVTVSPEEAATASAGGNQTILSGSNTAPLGGVVGGGATGGVWTTSGSGTFSPSATTLNAIYQASAADFAAQSVTLTLTTTGQESPCGPATAQVVVTFPVITMIYSNQLLNGWLNESYNSTINLANTSTVFPGDQNSISATITSAYGGVQLYHSPMTNSQYTSIGFLLNGGPIGGQHLQMYGDEGTGPTGQGVYYALTAPPANTWQQYWVPLSALGVANVANFSGFVIQDSAGTSEPTFFLDNIQLTSYPAPPLTPLSVNASQSIRTADPRWFALNATIWDDDLDTPQTIALLTNMGIKALRFPGGSDSDDFHWLYNRQDFNTWTWETSLASYIQVITNIGAQSMITLNYGSGTSNEAAAWVAYCNAATNSTVVLGTDANGFNWQTAGYWASLRAASPLGTDDGMNFLRIGRATPLSFKYWEIGNEEYGSWETDSNNVPHDPYTYGQRAAGYIALIKAVDPSAKVGVVVVPGTNTYVNNYNHPAVDPVTGQTDYGWTPVLMWTLNGLKVTPDFAIYHNYPFNSGQESDSALLTLSGPPNGWVSAAASLRQIINDFLGSNGTNTELVCTENNSVSSAPGKQSVSLVNGLYKLDSLGALMQTEFNGLFWWALRNGQETDGNLSPSLYGWRDYGDYGVVNIGYYTDPNLYPTYYTTELTADFAQPGDVVVAAASDYPLLSIYAAHRTNGTLTMLVINKDPTNTLTAQLTLSGFTPAANATAYSYGIPQDNAVENASQPTGVTQTTVAVTGTNLTYAFSPYSATVLVLSAPVAATPPQLTGAAVVTNGHIQLSFTNQTGLSFTVFDTTNLALPFNAWSNIGSAVETPAGSGNYNFTDTQPATTQRFYHVRSP